MQNEGQIADVKNPAKNNQGSGPKGGLRSPIKQSEAASSAGLGHALGKQII